MKILMGGKPSQPLSELQTAITNLQQTSEGFRDKTAGAIDMVSNRVSFSVLFFVKGSLDLQ